MTASCTRENLSAGLNVVGRSVGGRSSLPVLSNILIKTEKGGLKLSATDLEIGINTWIGAKVDDEGAITVPARLLMDYITNNNDKKVDLTLKGLDLNLSSDHFKVNIKGIDASEFPLIPEVKRKTEIFCQEQDFSQAIRKTIVAVAMDESRPVLAGLYFNIKGDSLKIVATDSYRLAEQKINLLKKVDEEISFIIPMRPMAEILRILDGTYEKISIYPGENQVEFVIGKTTLVSRLINGSFPDYGQIIPTTSTTSVSVNNSEFLGANKMAQIFAKDSANNIKLKLKSPSEISVSAASAHLGDNVSKVLGDVSGKELEISFNAKFILDVLQVLKSEKVKIDLSTASAPGLIFAEKDPGYLYVIMPIRTDE